MCRHSVTRFSGVSGGERFLIDGQSLTAEECRRLFAKAELSPRQQMVLSLIEGRDVVDIGCYAGLFVDDHAR